jgi:hypothetical protein
MHLAAGSPSMHLAPGPCGERAPPSPCRGGAATASSGWGSSGRWRGFTPLAARGGRRGGQRESFVLLQLLKRPDPHTVGDATPRNCGGFDDLEPFLLRGAAVDGTAEAPRRQDPDHHQFLDFDRQRPLLADAQAVDFGPGGCIGLIDMYNSVHITIHHRDC